MKNILNRFLLGMHDTIVDEVGDNYFYGLISAIINLLALVISIIYMSIHLNYLAIILTSLILSKLLSFVAIGYYLYFIRFDKERFVQLTKSFSKQEILISLLFSNSTLLFIIMSFISEKVSNMYFRLNVKFSNFFEYREKPLKIKKTSYRD